MPFPEKQYPADHWIRDTVPDRSLTAYLKQQSLAYSRVKNRFVRELLGDLAGKAFLDYGCGGGHFLVHAARSRARRVIGVDAEETVLNTARYYASGSELAAGVHFIRSDEFPRFGQSEKLDVILMKDVIEHVSDDRALIEAAAGALAPGGRIVVSTQNSWSLNYLIQGTWNRILLSNKDWYGWDPTHLRFYTPNRLRKKLSNGGFICRDWRSVYIIPYKWPALGSQQKKYIRVDPLSEVDLALGDRFPFNRLGWNIIVGAVFHGNIHGHGRPKLDLDDNINDIN